MRAEADRKIRVLDRRRLRRRADDAQRHHRLRPRSRGDGDRRRPYVAAERIRAEVPDVIFLDIELPRMDGITF